MTGTACFLCFVLRASCPGRFLAEADNMQQHPAMLTDQASVTDRAVSSMLQSLAELEAQGRLTQEARYGDQTGKRNGQGF